MDAAPRGVVDDALRGQCGGPAHTDLVMATRVARLTGGGYSVRWSFATSWQRRITATLSDRDS